MAREAHVALVVSITLASLAVVAPPAASTGGIHASPTQLWADPQNAPHPGWNWPTLANAPVGVNVPALWQPMPANALPGVVGGLQHEGRFTGNGGGAGIAVFGRIAVVPGYNNPTDVVDLSNPASPVKLSQLGSSSHRGAVIMAYPTGRLVTVLATSSQLHAWDITNPAAPFALPSVSPAGGSHKVGVVPGTPIVYNANSDGQGGKINIYDYSNPDAPVLVQNFASGYGCHHVYFWVNAVEDTYRSICAGIDATVLLDIADPRNPSIIQTIPFFHGVEGVPDTAVSPAQLSHFAILNEDATILVVGDETTGGLGPGCDVHAQAAGVSASGPLGNLYFYDVTVETEPKLLGWFNPGAHYLANRAIPGSCTAHHGRLVPDPTGNGRDLIAMAYYSAGTVLVDFSNPQFPQLVAQWTGGNPGTTTWESWYVNGWIVTGDLSRGLDVLRVV